MSLQLDTLRANAAALPAPSPELAGYLERVRERAYSVTDAQVEALLQAGCSEDEIFEQTVGVAIHEGLRRLDAAQRAIG